ncbi:MAG TPA: tRNA pseudouridine(38-40) synthase TruA [Acholeplasmataceae bacterium]|jgi:tRNA pseudouridine38-40 synthase|nr:tRNA pseudouridine(38-40) synthase TruA [Acholeplasmataceae bacterium]
MRYKCVCAYDGSMFHGFQLQKDLRTVQLEIEAVLLVIHKKKVRIYPSGRTDTGVHALNQVFHFDSDLEMAPENMKNAINSRLPKDVYIKEVEIVDESFHARYSAKAKEYHYLIDFGEFNPLLRNYRYFCHQKDVDLEKFKEALGVFQGVHDFRSFTKNKTTKNTVRYIYKIEADVEGTLVTVKIVGDGFLHNMVRIMVAMALEVGRGKITVDGLREIMAKKDRRLSPKILPPTGLYLFRVYY